ncbi:MAG: 5'-methylthioadenosine/adenosylhomocysteine nucleosidase [Alysiella sp.]|uniref:5'-methylthioadenosine/adenosylhomocysteine nucleosidase n=1 Tax=Alysiella sp. TaxID=1872483 RepID=UPI0026DC8E3C|nr:5'-methylthioadenosine/adenosylhomocysteine nucleosidase [Alysiella sp.]MDO4433373.1 5'-methylthioadenosine/adenosylhomocysteine nucleosidase [Alysiella sp.]
MSIKAQTIGIIGAMEAEIALLESQLNDLQTHSFVNDNFIIYTGKIASKNIVLSLSGIGKVNATIATTLLSEHFHPDIIINTGSAGAMSADLHIGDVVIGTETAHHDVDVTAFGYTFGQVPKQTARYASNSQLIHTATHAAQSFKNAHVQQGLIVSGDQFIHQINDKARILKYFPDVLAVEMEAAAIAQTCTQQKLPFVIIRAISDGASDDASISFEEFLQIASQHSAQMVLNIINAL